MLHVAHSTYEWAKKVFIISSDTDVFSLALHFWDKLKAYGLQVPMNNLLDLIKYFVARTHE